MFGQDIDNNQSQVSGGGGVAPPIDDNVVSNALSDDAQGTSDDLSNVQDESSSAQDDNLIHPTQPADDVLAQSSQASSDLEGIKKDAISQLSPLIKDLDQTPEDKFKTLLMMIQSADNQDLIKDAYQIAQKIDNKEERAKALLAIVNEIDYFTQKQK